MGVVLEQDIASLHPDSRIIHVHLYLAFEGDYVVDRLGAVHEWLIARREADECRGYFALLAALSKRNSIIDSK